MPTRRSVPRLQDDLRTARDVSPEPGTEATTDRGGLPLVHPRAVLREAVAEGLDGLARDADAELAAARAALRSGDAVARPALHAVAGSGVCGTRTRRDEADGENASGHGRSDESLDLACGHEKNLFRWR